jgi:hypothetical protein
MAKWREDPPGSSRWRKQLWVHGQPHQLTFKGAKADAELHEAQRRIELGAVTARANGTSVYAFEDFCASQYKPWAKAHLRESTYKVRHFQLENLILHFGRLKLPKLSDAMVEAYKLKRLAEHAEKAMVNSELNALSAVKTYARDIVKVPCADFKIRRFKVSKRRDKVECWTRDEVLRILAATQREAKCSSRSSCSCSRLACGRARRWPSNGSAFLSSGAS